MAAANCENMLTMSDSRLSLSVGLRQTDKLNDDLLDVDPEITMKLLPQRGDSNSFDSNPDNNITSINKSRGTDLFNYNHLRTTNLSSSDIENTENENETENDIDSEFANTPRNDVILMNEQPNQIENNSNNSMTIETETIFTNKTIANRDIMNDINNIAISNINNIDNLNNANNATEMDTSMKITSNSKESTAVHVSNFTNSANSAHSVKNTKNMKNTKNVKNRTKNGKNCKRVKSTNRNDKKHEKYEKYEKSGKLSHSRIDSNKISSILTRNRNTNDINDVLLSEENKQEMIEMDEKEDRDISDEKENSDSINSINNDNNSNHHSNGNIYNDKLNNIDKISKNKNNLNVSDNGNDSKNNNENSNNSSNTKNGNKLLNSIAGLALSVRTNVKIEKRKTEIEKSERIEKIKLREKAAKVQMKELEKVKWKDMKVKRGMRKGIYPGWARVRSKVYKKDLSEFKSNIVMNVQKMFSAKQVEPVAVERRNSTKTVLPLRPPNDHRH